MKRFCLALLTLLMFSSPVFADVVHLRDGTKLEGRIITPLEASIDRAAVEYELDGSTLKPKYNLSIPDTFEIQTEAGEVHTVRRMDAKSIVLSAPDIPPEVPEDLMLKHQQTELEVMKRQLNAMEKKLKAKGLTPPVETIEVEYKSAKRKKPLLAFGLSLLVPGTGQLYTGDYVDSSVHLFAATFGWDNYSRTKSKATLIGCVGIHIISAGKAMLKARRFNKNLIRLGHLIEIPKDRYTVGIDPINSHGKLGTRVALRF